ncbi:phosphotransferase family protein [Brachybacterium sp. YJGR34]|uniref:phosphotransferase family protein n=1 Tax=Brachybacterium sp. YJGR34 TaxID=2059911 RepID=UPI0018E63BC9|nr:phosphotransferase [Brachybacterium sp. YJGR34]
MPAPPPPVLDDPAADPVLSRILAATGLPVRGRFRRTAGWTSRAWLGEDCVVRLSTGPAHGAYAHEAVVAGLLAGSDVPHARRIAHGEGPDGAWYVSERLPGRTLHDAWPAADAGTRRDLIESLGAALRALHRVPVPADLLPPWLREALAGGPWPAYHPPVVGAALQQVEAARRVPGTDARLMADAAAWVRERLPLFREDDPVLVHGDLHGSNVMVEGGRVTGLIDFAESLAQPADAELDTILRWCAMSREYPPDPAGQGLDEAALAAVPGWLHGAYPQLFARPHLRERLHVYDMHRQLALCAHHPEEAGRAAAQLRVAALLRGHDHLDALAW